MSFGPLPERVDAYKLFAGNAEIRAVIELERMPRLSEYLLAGENRPVEAVLHFSRDQYRQRVLTGVLKTVLTTRCERCLGPVELQVESHMNVVVTASEDELKTLGNEQDVLLCTESSLDLLGALEDELILSLPLAPRHESKACNEALLRLNASAGQTGTDTGATTGNDTMSAQLQKLKEQLKKN